MRAAFLIDYTVTAAVLALWIHVRWPFTPTLKLYGAHLLAALVALNLLGAFGAPPVVVVALMFIALVYAFLVAAWGIEIVRSIGGLR